MLQMIYNFLESFAYISLAALGMSIIYGITGITNMAQGELMLIGAMVVSYMCGMARVPFIVGIIAAMAITAIAGIILDRLVLTRLYSRSEDSLVCTYGVSIALMQVGTIITGTGAPATKSPFGTVLIGSRSYSAYKFIIIAVALILFGVLYMVFNKSRFGLHARATMERREIAASLGINVNKMNILVIVLASALGGLAGALYAPTMSVTGTYGSNFLTHAFVAMIIGGANPLVGTFIAALVLAVVESVLSLYFGAFIGRIGMLLVAILIIRMIPGGFSGMVERAMVKSRKR
ncbi:MAG: branched-chain amino acid ABC transporter permease [Acetatifactor sp.]|nr:branched-chain amino acid ABC transporter permease [Acetatifactor sp.]